MNDLKDAGVNEVDAKNYCNAMLGSEFAAKLAEPYNRAAMVNEANGPLRNLGVKGLSAFDPRTMKPRGGNWDFTKRDHRKFAHKTTEEQNPDFLIGSPPCSAWCAGKTHMNIRNMDPEKVEAILEEGRINLRSVARMYRPQMVNKNFVVH